MDLCTQTLYISHYCRIFLCLEASVFFEQDEDYEDSLPVNFLMLAVLRFLNYIAIGSHLNRIFTFYLWWNCDVEMRAESLYWLHQFLDFYWENFV